MRAARRRHLRVGVHRADSGQRRGQSASKRWCVSHDGRKQTCAFVWILNGATRRRRVGVGKYRSRELTEMRSVGKLAHQKLYEALLFSER